MKHPMKYIFAIITTCMLLIAQPAFAIDLQTAKDQGLVGETPSGYLAAVHSPSADVTSMMNSVNAQRKEKYQEIATRNNTSLEAVELLAGKKAIEKSAPGSYIQINGAWQKK
ncbi:MAG: YdbL family protein [Gammaproteobacteria bacterium]